MHTGSCLCGGVRYALDAPIDSLSCCHCEQCRKAHGTAFVAIAEVDASALRFVAGEELLRAFSATPGKRRVFCGECGSPIYSARDNRPAVRRLRIGTLDTPLGELPRVHTFTASKADWYTITDGYPQYPGFAR